MNKSYQVEVMYDGKMWMQSIPELEGPTRPERSDEVDLIARKHIAQILDKPLDDVLVAAGLGGKELRVFVRSGALPPWWGQAG